MSKTKAATLGTAAVITGAMIAAVAVLTDRSEPLPSPPPVVTVSETAPAPEPDEPIAEAVTGEPLEATATAPPPALPASMPSRLTVTTRATVEAQPCYATVPRTFAESQIPDEIVLVMSRHNIAAIEYRQPVPAGVGSVAILIDPRFCEPEVYYFSVFMASDPERVDRGAVGTARPVRVQ